MIESDYIIKTNFDSKYDEYVSKMINDEGGQNDFCEMACIYRNDGTKLASSPKEFQLEQYAIHIKDSEDRNSSVTRDTSSSSQVYNEF